MLLTFSFSRTRRRTAYHYIKKNKRGERNPIQHHTLTPWTVGETICYELLVWYSQSTQKQQGLISSLKLIRFRTCTHHLSIKTSIPPMGFISTTSKWKAPLKFWTHILPVPRADMSHPTPLTFRTLLIAVLLFPAHCKCQDHIVICLGY